MKMYLKQVDQILQPDPILDDARPLESTESLPTERPVAIGYAQRKTKDSNEDDDDDYTFEILLKTTIIKSRIPQLERNLSRVFGNTRTVKIENGIALSDNKCILTLSVSDLATNRKIPSADILRHLCQPKQHQKLSQALSNNLIQIIPLQEVNEEDVEEYLSEVPDGVDPEVWDQAILNNPNPEKYIPILLEYETENIEESSFTSKPTQTDTRSFSLILGIAIILLIPVAVVLHRNLTQEPHITKNEDIMINLENINKINKMYPELITAKKMRIIMTRLAVMSKEVSILMLLGKSRDRYCKLDPTFCVGQAIANVTQLQFGYIDAADPYLQSYEMAKELRSSLEGERYSVMIDSLEKLPGSEVMGLFQFIDKDVNHRKRGMLLFVVYTGNELSNEFTSLKEADIAERILMEKWSPFIPKDSLTSVISRMCGSIVKVF